MVDGDITLCMYVCIIMNNNNVFMYVKIITKITIGSYNNEVINQLINNYTNLTVVSNVIVLTATLS